MIGPRVPPTAETSVLLQGEAHVLVRTRGPGAGGRRLEPAGVELEEPAGDRAVGQPVVRGPGAHGVARPARSSGPVPHPS